MRYPIILLLLLCIYKTNAQSSKIDLKQFDIVNIAFYNVENLFDTIDTEGVYDSEYTPLGKKKWNSIKYNQKLENLAEVIHQLGFQNQAPDLLGLAEIENRSVIEDLIKQNKLNKLNYKIVHYDSPDKRGIDVGLIYNSKRFKVDTSFTRTLTLPKDTSFFTRDLLCVQGKIEGEAFNIFIAHWPSRRGGEKQSSYKRIAAAKMARQVIDSLTKLNPTVKTILMGDLNDDPTSASVKQNFGYDTRKSNVESDEFYNPLAYFHKKGIGTLTWNKKWFLFDQILLSHNLTDESFETYKYYGAKVFNKPFVKEYTGSFKGYPFRTYAGDKFLGGYSDHLPVYLFLVRKR